MGASFNYSAFVYKKIGCEGILRLLLGFERSAFFASSIGFACAEGIKTFEGRIDGRISEEINGDGGFGYDPIFIPEDSNKCFALDPETKAEVSHRKKAFESFCKYLTER